MKRITTILLSIVLLATSYLPAYAEVLKLPAGLKHIEDEAFMNDASISEVELPEGITSIGADAFAYEQNLTSITIPKTVRSIADNAFEGSDNVIIIASEGSDAWNWAIDHGYYTVSYDDSYDDSHDDKLELLSTEGIEDQETLEFIWEVNADITEINHMTDIHKMLIRSMESKENELDDYLNDFQINGTSGSVDISYGSYSLIIDEDIYTKLSAEESITEVETTDDGIITMKIGGVQCWVDTSEDTLHIYKGTPVFPKAAYLAKSLTDSDLRKTETKKHEFDEKIKKYSDLYVYIDKTLTELENINANQIEKLKELIEKYNRQIAQGDTSEGSPSINKKVTQDRLDEVQEQGKKLSGLRGTLTALSFYATKKHMEEVASHWTESIEIYNHKHLEDITIYNTTLEKTAQNLDVYIKRLWILYSVDALAALADLFSIGQDLKNGLNKMIPKKKTVVTTKAAPLVVAVGMAAVVYLVNKVFSILCDRTYNYMKEAEDDLHTELIGKVTDGNSGVPLENVEVKLVWGFGNTLITYTFSDGTYSFHVPPRSCEVSFHLDGYEDLTIRGIPLENFKHSTFVLDDPQLKRDGIFFGHYDQDDNTANGKEPIEWIILENDGTYATMISRYALDAQPYNTERADVTWSTCTLRSWLNSTFLNAAFTASEQSKMKAVTISNPDNPYWGTEGGPDTTDKVYLLSIGEAEAFFDSDKSRMCSPTDTAIANGCVKSNFYILDDKYTCWWWLRSPGYGQDGAAGVGCNGLVGGGGKVNLGGDAVRPVVVVQLSAIS